MDVDGSGVDWIGTRDRLYDLVVDLKMFIISLPLASHAMGEC